MQLTYWQWREALLASYLSLAVLSPCLQHWGGGGALSHGGGVLITVNDTHCLQREQKLWLITMSTPSPR